MKDEITIDGVTYIKKSKVKDYSKTVVDEDTLISAKEYYDSLKSYKFRKGNLAAGDNIYSHLSIKWANELGWDEDGNALKYYSGPEAYLFDREMLERMAEKLIMTNQRTVAPYFDVTSFLDEYLKEER